MVKLERKEKPKTCECWVLDKNTKMARRCTNKIEFINGASGGFICLDCANKFHKRFPGYSKKFKEAKKYLKLWF
jgi:hypothetical protein